MTDAKVLSICPGRFTERGTIGQQIARGARRSYVLQRTDNCPLRAEGAAVASRAIESVRCAKGAKPS